MGKMLAFLVKMIYVRHSMTSYDCSWWHISSSLMCLLDANWPLVTWFHYPYSLCFLLMSSTHCSSSGVFFTLAAWKGGSGSKATPRGRFTYLVWSLSCGLWFFWYDIKLQGCDHATLFGMSFGRSVWASLVLPWFQFEDYASHFTNVWYDPHWKIQQICEVGYYNWT